MASGRDFARDAEGGERDALIGIQTCGGTILRGATMPPSPGGPAGREGIRRSPRTGRKRSPPSPVRSSGQDWPALREAERAAGGEMGAPEPRRPEEDRTSPFRAADRAPPGFTILAAGPALDLRPEWLGDPRGTPQRISGENIDRGRQDARLEPLRGPHQEGRTTPKKKDSLALRDEREAPHTRFRIEEDDWNDSPGHQTPPWAKGLASSPMHLQLPPVAPALMAQHHSSCEGSRESRTRTEGEIASISLNFLGQAPRVEATLNAHGASMDTQGQHRRNPRSSLGRLDRRQRQGLRRFPRCMHSGRSTLNTSRRLLLSTRRAIGPRGKGPDLRFLDTRSSTINYPAAGAGVGAGPPGGGGPPGYPPAYPYAPPPPAWNQPPYGAHASQPKKVFQPFKTKIFKGVRREKGAKARRFVKTMEMYRDSTHGMTQSQMGATMYANMDDSAKDWVHAEDEEYKCANGGMSLLHNWEELRRRFLER
jgi:hypothetical protein